MYQQLPSVNSYIKSFSPAGKTISKPTLPTMLRKGSNLDYQDNQILDTIRNQYREDIRSPELKHGGKNRGRNKAQNSV